jgi:hypothetical protein
MELGRLLRSFVSRLTGCESNGSAMDLVKADWWVPARLLSWGWLIEWGHWMKRSIVC